MKTYDPVKDIITAYQPEMLSDDEFMAQLSRKLEAVEMFKRNGQKARKSLVTRLLWTAASGAAGAAVIMAGAFLLPASWSSQWTFTAIAISAVTFCSSLLFFNFLPAKDRQYI